MIPPNFYRYAKDKGCVILFEDKKFIEKRLRNVPQNLLRSVLMRYIEIWSKSAVIEKNMIKKQNTGRRSANTFLREL
jgi:hypothetical protein